MSVVDIDGAGDETAEILNFWNPAHAGFKASSRAGVRGNFWMCRIWRSCNMVVELSKAAGCW